MTVALAPDYIEESFLPNGGYTSANVVPTVTGGTAPYTYSWARTLGSTAIALAYAPSTKDMAFTASGTNKRYESYFRCTVTDSSVPAKVAISDPLAIVLGFNVSAYPEEPPPDDR
jgi:hypothetical protein